MKRPRLSIAGLMAAVVLIALGLAALASPTTLWASLAFTATVTFLATAILAVIARRGRARTVWAGIALFGWISLALTFGPIANGNGVTVPPSPAQALGDYLRGLQEAADLREQQRTAIWVVRPDSGSYEGVIVDINQPFAQTTMVFTGPGVITTPPMGALPPSPSPPAGTTRAMSAPRLDWINLRRIVHSIGAIAFGLLGGLIGGWLARRDDTSTTIEREPTPT